MDITTKMTVFQSQNNFLCLKKLFIGNCLELAGNGILNQVSCKTFSSGCPDRFFFSNELYKCKLFQFALLHNDSISNIITRQYLLSYFVCKSHNITNSRFLSILYMTLYHNAILIAFYYIQDMWRSVSLFYFFTSS